MLLTIQIIIIPYVLIHPVYSSFQLIYIEHLLCVLDAVLGPRGMGVYKDEKIGLALRSLQL